MKSLSANMTTHLQGEVLTLATCWKVTRQDSTILRFTNHDQDIVIGGDGTYEASTGFTGSGVSSSSDLRVDELEVQSVLTSTTIKEVDLISGKFDLAQVEIFLVNYNALGDGIIQIRKGWLGEFRLGSDGVYFTEVRGMMQLLQNTYGEVLTSICRADLGDSRCGVALGPLTVTGTVKGVTTQLFKITSDQTNGFGVDYWQYGQLTWTSGDNIDVKHDIKGSSGDDLEFFNPTPFSIQVGDAFSIFPGCNKLISTCNDRFSNVNNFRGEPHLPGQDRVLRHA